MADRDSNWREHDDDDYEGRYGREGFPGPNREGASRSGRYEGRRGHDGYGGYGGFSDHDREFGGRYGAGYRYGGETGWDRDLEIARAFDRSREYGPSRGFGDRQGTAIGRPNYSGRGPRNWRRSDERITEDVNERLARDPDLDATDVEVRVNEGVVTLSGIVEDRRDKRRAEDIAEDVFGVDDIQNELKVRHGFLSRLTGEHADEREVTRHAERDSSTAAAGTPSSGSRAANPRTTSRT